MERPLFSSGQMMAEDGHKISKELTLKNTYQEPTKGENWIYFSSTGFVTDDTGGYLHDANSTADSQ